MRFFRSPKWLIGGGIVLAGLIVGAVYLFHSPAKEISRAEFEGLMQTKALSGAHVTPTPYAGIYQVEGKRHIGEKSNKVYLTTHLDEAQLKMLFDRHR